MADPKDIGKAFKEKLKGFDQARSTLTWEDIEPKLPKKRENTLSYWAKGVGISLLLLLLILSTSDTYPDSNTSILSNNSIQQNHSTIDNCEEIDTQQNNQIIVNNIENKSIVSALKASEVNTDNAILNILSLPYNTSNYKRNSSTNTSNSNSKFKTTTTVRSTFRDKSNSSNTTQKNNLSLGKKENSYTNPSIDKNKEYPKYQIKSEKLGAEISNSKKSSIHTRDKNFTENEKRSLENDSIHKKETLITMRKPKDTLIYINPLKKKPFQKFSLALHVAPTYLIPLSGSLISDRLSENKNNGKISLNYGIVFKTYFNEKTALRIGYNRLKLSNTIKNVPATQLSAALRDAGIFFSSNDTIQNSEDVDLTQKTKLHELSIGIQYSIIDKKINTSLIGGLSFLFFDKNNITINTASNDFKVGSNENLLKTNFSIHMGANFRYELSKKIMFNVEPLINYQLKNASENSNSYSPLHFTIQTGFSYEF
ncbi:hypothetical protein [Aquimarina algiphila]|uniref:hypothetical protein n=1 Tax=Aquimarina algiphila TaxID=2047982 RepID=UPI00232ACCF7|nr:hypothetical protein [Aquimarina algiphila]